MRKQTVVAQQCCTTCLPVLMVRHFHPDQAFILELAILQEACLARRQIQPFGQGSVPQCSYETETVDSSFYSLICHKKSKSH